ncbi:unnamed protein product [Phytophthora fragariaefolia]|uniref:Unnamed protein product n=1 Tax=Phytophthora fragariaefolia TaxID=1490495 RepID=A0A9W6XRV4_9STRA|nr:unnamed protein product [Phytophthora fragariaefolia]
MSDFRLPTEKDLAMSSLRFLLRIVDLEFATTLQTGGGSIKEVSYQWYTRGRFPCVSRRDLSGIKFKMKTQYAFSERTCVSDRHLTSASSTDSMIDSTLSKSASTQSISSTTSWLEMNCRSGSPLPRRRVPLVQVALVDEPRHQAAGLNVAVVVRLVDVGVDNKREAAAEEVGVEVAERVDEPRGHGVARPSSQPGRRTL